MFQHVFAESLTHVDWIKREKILNFEIKKKDRKKSNNVTNISMQGLK